MALINCSECGKEISDKAAACPNCGNPIEKQAEPSVTAQQYTPPPFVTPAPIKQGKQPKPKKPWYKRVWVWLLIVFVGLPVLSGIMSGITGGSKTAETSASISSSKQESSKSESSKADKDDMDERLLKIIQYHKDKMNGTESEAALKGSETAFNLNLKLYKSDDDLKYRTYYYALKGEQEYINEFDDDMLEEVKNYIKALDKENITEKAFEKYAIEAEEKEKEFQESLIKVSAVELAKAYSDNEVKANSLYKDKMVEVSGTVDSIGAGIANSVFITLSDGNAYSLSAPQFSFKEQSEKDKVAELSKGDYVIIIGKCTGEVVGKPMISDCYFVD